ncbi:MAG: hypothetical protein KKB31_06465, partial [Nanoarchaeota archaeon]|nr:hypothetical protein [Nanoarchaeota archaeon]
MKKSWLLLFSIFLISFISAGQTFCAIPIDSNNNYNPNQHFVYTLNFTTNINCSGITKSFTVDVITNTKGVDCFELDLTDIGNPKYLCEYKDGVLRKVHNVTDQMVNNLHANNINATIIYQNGSKVLDVSDILSLNNTDLIDILNQTIISSNSSWLSTYNSTYNSRINSVNSSILIVNTTALSINTTANIQNLLNSTGVYSTYNSTYASYVDTNE